MVVGSLNGKVYAWHQNGTTVAGWPQTTGGSIDSSPALGDLDGDGDLEVVVGSSDYKVYAWHHNGTTVAGWPQTTGLMVDSSPALGDLDGDGDIEVVVGSSDYKVYAWHHNGTTVAGWPQTTGGTVWFSSPALGDLDGDGDLEVVIGSENGKVYAWHHNGTTVAAWPQTTGGMVDSSPALGDLDGDGDLEVVVGSRDNKVYAWHHNGVTVAGWPQTTGYWVLSSPALGDLDGDGTLEVVVGSFDYKVYVWHHNGTTVAGWPQTTGGEVWSSPALGDLDGDGDIEVIVGSFDRKVWAWDCSGAYDPANVPWPMFHHDARRTGLYWSAPITVDITAPGEGALLSTKDVTVNWTGSDNIRIDHFEVRVDSGGWVDVGKNTSHIFYNLSDGSHSVEVVAFDKMGKNATDSVSFVVDTSPPTVEIILPEEGAELFNIDVRVIWTCVDNLRIDHYEVSLNSGGWIDVGTNTSYTLYNLPEGFYSVNVRAFDQAGNNATDSVSFIVALANQTGWPQTTEREIRSSPALGDLDGDGDLEVVVGSFDGKVYAWHHNGTPVAGWPQTTGGIVWSSPALGDLDGDGDIEVVVGSYDGKVYAWHHNGIPVAGWPQTTGGYVVSSPALGDLDGDEDLEVVVGSNDNNTYAWHHNGTTVAGWPQTTGFRVWSSPALGDLDGDGDLEVVVGSWDRKVYAWHHNGTTVAGWPQTTGNVVDSSPALGDLDGDGDLEVVVGSEDRKVYAWHHNGTTVAGWPQTTGNSVGYSSPALGDLDGDEDLEVVVGSNDNKVYAWHHNGTTVAGWPQTTGYWVGSSPALGDLDGDGDIEVVVGSIDYKVYAWHHNGIPVAGWPQTTGGRVWSSPALGDLDSDGDIEVVVGSYDRKVYVWDCFGAYDSDNVPWPMFHHDVCHTGLYLSVSLVVSIKLPVEGQLLPSADVTVTWIGLSLGGINHYEVSIDGGGWIPKGTSTSHTFIGLSNGPHMVDVMIFDKLGNNATDSVSFTVDSTPPVIDITSPSEGTMLSTNEVNVIWGGSDNMGIDHYEVRIDGGAWVDVGMSTSYQFLNLSEGSHNVEVKIVDGAGLTGSDTVSFTVDITPPAVDITSPSEGAVIPSGDVTVIWSGSDATSGINHYEIRIDGGGWENMGTSNSKVFSGLANGSYIVEVMAFDNVGFSDSDTVSFIFGTGAPSVIITYPGDGAVIGSDVFNITWSSGDTDIAYYLVSIDAESSVNVSLATLYLVNRGEGAHTINITAVDLTGFSGWDIHSFAMDITPPEVNITTPSPDEVFNTNSVTVNWTASDDYLDCCMWRLDGGIWNNMGSAMNYTFTGLSSGSHTVDIMAVDEAGHNTTDTVTFTVNLPPAPALAFVPLLVSMSLMQQQGVPLLYIAIGGAAVAVAAVAGVVLWLWRRP